MKYFKYFCLAIFTIMALGYHQDALYNKNLQEIKNARIIEEHVNQLRHTRNNAPVLAGTTIHADFSWDPCVPPTVENIHYTADKFIPVYTSDSKHGNTVCNLPPGSTVTPIAVAGNGHFKVTWNYKGVMPEDCKACTGGAEVYVNCKYLSGVPVIVE